MGLWPRKVCSWTADGLETMVITHPSTWGSLLVGSNQRNSGPEPLPLLCSRWVHVTKEGAPVGPCQDSPPKGAVFCILGTARQQKPDVSAGTEDTCSLLNRLWGCL